MAIAIWLFPEPERGGLDPGQQTERPPLREALMTLAHNKAYVLITLAYTVQLFAYNPIEFWLPTVLQRDKAIPMAQANSAYGAVVIVAGTLGPLIGGLLADRLVRRFRSVYYWICIATALASVPPIVAFLLLPNGKSLFTAIFAEVFLGNMSTGIVFTVLVTIVIPGLRATATAIVLTVIHVLGDAISEPLIGSISTYLHGLSATRVAMLSRWLPPQIVPQHLMMAICVVSAPAMALSSLLYLGAKLSASGPTRTHSSVGD
jgi:hypothetical protein